MLIFFLLWLFFDARHETRVTSPEVMCQFKFKVMKNILIADAGSTKTQWVLLKEGLETAMCETKGFNPNYNRVDDFKNDLKSSLQDDFQQNIDSIYYYGTGCGSEKNRALVADALKEVFGEVRIEVTHDMMAAARAVLGRNRGVACILGTGSNACLYDAGKIVKNAVSLGYILGDEGGGADIGSHLLRDYFYGLMPADLREKFGNQFPVSREEVIQKVYREQAPSAFLAMFAKFAGQNIDNQYIRDLCYDCFSHFADYHILPLCEDCDEVGFVGSVAYHFADILRQCINDKGMKIIDIVKQPMEGLVRYHHIP